MKKSFLAFGLLLSLNGFSADVKLNEYDWNVTDITTKGFTKESFFEKMDRKFIKVNSSICSNRALLWAYDFKTKYDLDTAKIFLFYTKKTGDVGRKTWWYHVSPMVNENGELWVVDAGFPAFISGPQKQEDWLHSFVGSAHCKEIKANDTDLIERMFVGAVYPETTSHGTYDCYYRIVPGSYWTPATIAMNLLGKDADGRPVRFERPEINLDEVYTSCIEASTGVFGRFFGKNKKECAQLVGRDY